MRTTRNIYYVHDNGSAELNIGDKTVLLDASDVPVVAEYQWTVGTHGYVTHGSGEKQVLMHRLLLGNKPGTLVDHINRNRLDNRRENLRLCTSSQNSINKKQISNNPYKGICLCSDGVWQAQISYKGKSIYLGRTQDPMLAAKLYDSAAKRLYGEYAFLNFLDSVEDISVQIKRRKKLSSLEVNSIRQLSNDGIQISEIAQIYKHSYSAIHRIIKCKTFKESTEVEQNIN